MKPFYRLFFTSLLAFFLVTSSAPGRSSDPRRSDRTLLWSLRRCKGSTRHPGHNSSGELLVVNPINNVIGALA